MYITFLQGLVVCLQTGWKIIQISNVIPITIVILILWKIGEGMYAKRERRIKKSRARREWRKVYGM